MMVVPQHPHVEQTTGKCFVPYLSGWTAGNNLLQLVHLLRDIFGRHPPVRTKPAPPPPYYPAANQPPPYSDYYGRQPDPMAFPTPTRDPALGNSMVNPMTSSMTMSAYPTAQYPPPNNTPNTMPTSSYPPTNPFGTYGNMQPQQRPAPQLGYTPNMGYQPPYEDPAKAEERRARTLLDEKLREKMVTYIFQKKEEIERSHIEGDELKDEYQRILDQKAKLLEEKRKMAEVETQWRRQVEELSAWIVQYDKPETERNLDEITEPTDEIQSQLLHLRAEDAAIDDTQYYLDKALQKGSIDLNSFLKATRNLSEEQFYRRALINKLNTLVAPTTFQ